MKLVERCTSSVIKITHDYEIILVDDGSDDNSWNVIENSCNSNLNLRGIKLSKNFGQHYAITAGLKQARGDYVFVLDCDLEDDPSYFELFLGKTAN